jgi:hypothetical protein
MKYCYACGQTTGGKPLFCNFCGRSYDVKLCPSRHMNPRMAEACSRCGSRNLSLPQPRIPLLWRILAVAFLLVIGICLAAFSSAFAIEVWKSLVVSGALSGELVAHGLMLAVLGGLWSILPDCLRIVIRRSLKRRSDSPD